MIYFFLSVNYNVEEILLLRTGALLLGMTLI